MPARTRAQPADAGSDRPQPIPREGSISARPHALAGQKCAIASTPRRGPRNGLAHARLAILLQCLRAW
ncbi:hypothetical protein K523DRAFT_325743 [Schizophyllum commune Tattone D]|nr:hypothetical protein K523DRAFT_325743 [Schizophyllum commune Tattone D]